MADNTNYLAKLLTLLIRRNGDSIRIPASDLMADDAGQGFQVHFDQSAKELVLTFVPPNSNTFIIKESVTWLTNNQLPNPPLTPPSSRSQDELLARVWANSAATPTVEEERARQPRNKVRVITDESLAEGEVEKIRNRALRDLEEYQPQDRTPPNRPSSRVATTFSKP